MDTEKIMTEILSEVKKEKQQAPDKVIKEFVVSLDEKGSLISAMPIEDVRLAAGFSLVDMATKEIERKQLKKLTQEEKEKLGATIYKTIQDEKADRDLAMYYVGARMKKGEQQNNNKIGAFVHVAEAWGVVAEKGKEEEAIKIAPSKNPNRRELLSVTCYVIKERKMYATSAFFTRNGEAITFDEKQDKKASGNNTETKSPLFDKLILGYDQQTKAEEENAPIEPAEKVEALFKTSLGDKLTISDVSV